MNAPERMIPLRFRLVAFAVSSIALCSVYAQATLSQALVAQYRFDGSAYDSAGTAHGTPTGVSFGHDRFGRTGRAVMLNGSAASRVAINSTNWNLPPEFSASVWFLFSANAGTQNPRVLSAAGWEIGTQTTAPLRKVFLNNTTAGAGAFTVESTNAFAADTWIHAIAVRSSNQLTLYVNGAFAGSISVPQPPDYSLGLPEIGGNFHNGFDAFAGAVDDVRIYHRALSASDVQQLHAFESQPPPLSLSENLWPFPWLESDADADGLPDFWAKETFDPAAAAAMCVWDTNAISGLRSITVVDDSPTQYGRWYSTLLSVQPGGRYRLNFKRRYDTVGAMRFTAAFISPSNTFVSSVNFVASGTQLEWESVQSELNIPVEAKFVYLELLSAGTLSATGSYWIDDISLVALWPNPRLENDSDANGTPDFWNKGGSNPLLDVWDTNSFASASHSLAIWDNDPTGYGGWFSQPISVLPGEKYLVQFKRRYSTVGPVFFSARYFAADGTFLSATDFPSTGTKLNWEQVAAEVVVPAGAAKLDVQTVSGGALDQTQTNWIDDVSVSLGTQVSLVSTGSVWRFLDDGSDQGTAWSTRAFNDTSWASGPAQLGYGEGDEATLVSFGPNPSNKFVTTYFRHSFAVENATLYTNLIFRLLRDDGAVVYLNGVEVWRSNMPTNQAITYATLAPLNVGGTNETTFFELTTDASLLSNGLNVLAVEIHQNNRTNTSDCSFDFELIGNVNFAPPPLPDAGFYDDFEPDIDTNHWSQFGGFAQANGNGESVSGVNGLWFGGSGSRFAATRALNTTAGGLVQFHLRYANGSDATWERPELPNDSVVLEYSIDATNWVIAAQYTNTYFAWTLIELPIPTAARSSATRFRWRQLANNGSSFDHWALDDVRVAGVPIITTQPSSSLGHVQSTVTLSVNVTSLLPASYQWFRQGSGPIAGGTGAALSLTNFSLANAGNYFVVISNAAGVVTSAVATITFSPAIVPFASEWKYFDSGVLPAADWMSPAFDDSAWTSGPAQLGYGDGDEQWVVSFGPQSNNKYITTYFRRTFNLTDPTQFTNLLLRVLRDDGAVVHVNGVEVFRSNMPTGAINYATRALWPVSEEKRIEETNYVQRVIPTNVLVGGANTIAVEIHQVNPTSTDVSFALEIAGNIPVPQLPPLSTLAAPAAGQTFALGASVLLRAIAFDRDGTVARVEFFAGTNKLAEMPGTNLFSGLPTNQFAYTWSNLPAGTFPLKAVVTDDDGLMGESETVVVTVLAGVKFPLIGTGATWKYWDNGSDQGTNWTRLDFDDAAWLSGPAQLGYGDGDESTVVSYGPVATNKYTTTYFRRAFVLNDSTAFTNLTLNLLRDDGAVVYLNGEEILRSNMPTNLPILFSTFATANTATDENRFLPQAIPNAPLRSGTNVIAVEIHQFNLTSSDIGFDLEFGVSGVPGAPLVFVNGAYDPRDRYTATNSAVIEIQTAFANGIVLYTLDGSEPSVDSPLYEGPFTVTNSVVVRAIAYASDFSQVVAADPVGVTILPSLRLNVSVVGGGQVTLNPPGGFYVSNTLVTLTAQAQPNWRFVGWNGAASGTNPIATVLVTQATNAIALFEAEAFCVEGTALGGGTVLPLPAKAVAFWSGSGAGTDAVGARHLTLMNGASVSNSSAGRAFSFDGVDDVAIRFNDVATTNIDNWCFAARVLWRGLSGPGKTAHSIFHNGNSAQNGYGLLVFDQDGCAAFPECDAPGRLMVTFAGIMHIPTGVLLPTNVWTHVAVSRVDGVLRLFTNGVQAFSAETDDPHPPLPANGVIRISDGTGHSFAGLIDEVAVFNRGLAAIEIAGLSARTAQCVPVNQTLALVAMPLPGWRFLKWLGDAEGTNSTTAISMTRPSTVEAVFGTTLATTLAGNGTVAFDPPGSIYPFGATVRLTATPVAGSYFALWGNAASGTTNPLLFRITNANPVVSALFQTLPVNQFSLVVNESGFGRVTVSPSANRYANGAVVTLMAVPAPSQSFLGWSGDAGGANPALLLTMNGNRSITANFTRRPAFALQGGPSPQFHRLTLNGEPGQRYQVDASTNLIEWLPLTFVTNSFGTGQFSDGQATNYPARFYRATVVP